MAALLALLVGARGGRLRWHPGLGYERDDRGRPGRVGHDRRAGGLHGRGRADRADRRLRHARPVDLTSGRTTTRIPA